VTLRTYQGWARHAERPSRRYLGWLSWVALSATAGAQFLFPALAGANQNLDLYVGVYSAAALALMHSAREFGTKYVAILGSVTLLSGLVIFDFSARTAWPFGHVVYAGTLGPKIDRAPVLLIVALLAAVYPMLLLGRRLSIRWTAIVGGFGFLAWDLLVDPVLNHNGYWTWDQNVTRTPGIPGTPLSNTAGMLLIGLALVQVLHWFLPRDRDRSARALTSGPIDMLLLVGFLAGIFNNVYLHHTSIAVIGGALYFIVLAPYLVSKWLARA
jgi:uncharacterized membrane protein